MKHDFWWHLLHDPMKDNPWSLGILGTLATLAIASVVSPWRPWSRAWWRERGRR